MIDLYYFSLDPGGTTGTACIFVADTGSIGNSTYQQEQKNITGAAGAVVSIQVVQLINTNGGAGAYYGIINAHLNDVFTVTLDGSGNGNFISKVTGNPANTGTVIFIKYTIIGVTTGYIGSPNSVQTSKVY